MRFSELLEDNRSDVLAKVPNIGDLKKLADIFEKEGFQLRLVGGVVRDLLQGKTPKDVDLATTATPDQMLEIGEKYNLKTIPTGLQHGTLTFVIKNEPYEITTLRIDTETDGRHAEVEFTTDWRVDAERRDLTFNAMSMDFDGELYDYFGGEEDLKKGRAAFVGDANARIQEDYLRILRYFRFQSRTEKLAWDEETLKAIKANASGLKQISGERIWMELRKILPSDKSPEIIEYMAKTNVLTNIQLPINNVNSFRKNRANTKSPTTLLAGLLNNKSEAEAINNRYKFSAGERDKLYYIVDNKDKKLDKSSALSEVIINKVPKPWVVDLLALQGNTGLARAIHNTNIQPFPVSGKDLMAAGIKPGPQMGELLRSMQKQWIDSGFRASKEELLGSLK